MDAGLISLCERAALKLSGHKTEVRFRETIRKGADGEAGRSGQVGYIHIAPGLSLTRILEVLCHEAGHIKDLWNDWSDKVDLSALPPGSIGLPPQVEIVKAIETTAENWAKTWLEYADKQADKYQGDWLESRLRALAEFDPIKSIADRAVDKAVDDVIKKIKNRR